MNMFTFQPLIRLRSRLTDHPGGSILQSSLPGSWFLAVLFCLGAVAGPTPTKAAGAYCGVAPWGMVAWWPGETNGVDVFGGNDVSLFGGATYSAGKVGRAFSFNGTTARAQLGDVEALKFGGSFSFEAWVYLNSIYSGFSFIVFRGDDREALDPFYLGVAGPDGLYFHIGSTNGTSRINTTVQTNRYFHVAATLDHATGYQRLYVDGVLRAETVTTIRPLRNLDPLFNPGVGIGNHPGYPTSPYQFPLHGSVDEPSFYDRALTPTEVAALYAAGVDGKCPPVPVVRVNSQVWAGPEVPFIDPVQVSLETPLPGGTIRYTLNGTDPANGSLYPGPFTVDQELTLRAISFNRNGVRSADSRTVAFRLDRDIRLTIDASPITVNGVTTITIDAFADNVQGVDFGDCRLAIYDADRLIFIRPFINLPAYHINFEWVEPPLGTHCLRAVGVDNDELSNPRTNSSSPVCIGVGSVSALGFTSSQVATSPFPPNEDTDTTVFGSVVVANQTAIASGPLRVRLQRNRSFFFLPSQQPSFIPDSQEELLSFQSNRPEGLAGGGVFSVNIPSLAAITCPPFEEFEFGSGFQYHIFAVLEEYIGGAWVFVDRTKLFSSIIKVWFPFNDGAIGIDPLPSTNQFAFLTNLVILAPASIPEGQSLNLVAVGALNDGSTGTVNAAWSSDLPSLAPDGLFQVPFVTADQNVSVTAIYQRRTTRSDTRTLTILDLGDPPLIVSPPAPQVVTAGSAAAFNVQAGGTAPLSFQWLFNRTNVLSGATSPNLSLGNVQAAQAGLYSVMVTNRAGAVTSAPVALTIVAQPALSSPATLANGSFRFVIHGQAGNQWDVQVSTDLKTWTTVSNLTLNGATAEFLDPLAGQTPRRFFKLRSPPPP